MSEPSTAGWRVIGPEVVPVNDLRPHSIGDGCWCDPHYDGGILVHNSMDCREAYERGERQAS